MISVYIKHIAYLTRDLYILIRHLFGNIRGIKVLSIDVGETLHLQNEKEGSFYKLSSGTRSVVVCLSNHILYI